MNTNIETVFKVVRALPGEEYRSFVNFKIKAMQLTYRIGEITKPIVKNSMIFAFRGDFDATDFARSSGLFRIAIMKCEAEIGFFPFDFVASSPDVLSIYSYNGSRRRLVYLYWNDLESYKKEVGQHLRFKMYPGTVLCKWVKPVEVVAHSIARIL